MADPAGESATYEYDAVGNILSISRKPSSQVSIIEFTPKSGPVNTTVTLSGTGFSTTASQNTIKFNGVTAAVSSATATQIIARVPTGAITGLISVTTPTGSASSNTPFTVAASGGAPIITSFTPVIGSAGTAVAITGRNFDSVPANNKVLFNSSHATVSSATNTSINTAVPAATSSGRISVATAYGTAVSTSDFLSLPLRIPRQISK